MGVDFRASRFISHWWGESVADFIKCVRRHSKDRKLAAATFYWVCAYANNQHQLAGDVTEDPAATSFNKAMALSEGTLTILDRGGVSYTRIWYADRIEARD